MNFLAHLFLSGGDQNIKTGNFIGDWVKGSAFKQYNQQIQIGIKLHRRIDYFTDRHDITKEICLKLKDKYGRHSGIVVDIFYDHLLCKNWKKYSAIKLQNFIKDSYKILILNFAILPNEIKGFLPIMIAKNRLLSYSKINGIEKTLKIMANRTSLPDEGNFAMEVLKNNYQELNQKFIIFFDEIIEYTNNEIKVLKAEYEINEQ